MVATKLDTFGGMIPAVDDRLLPPKAAAHSENTWLYSGRLSGIPQPELVRANTPGTSKVFRIPNNYVDGEHLADSVWMEFQNPDTDVAKAMVIGDTFDRYYWASISAAPQYNTKARIVAASAAWLLGVPGPAAATCATAGGTGLATSRAYVTTWVSDYGEEGPASLPVVHNGKIDDTWTLTLTAADPADIGTNRNLTHTNIYRTVTSSAGVATYFFVAQIPIATLTYADSASDTSVSSNAIIESTNWIGPPSDLQGFIAMPNGILAGWRGNEIWFCEPYRPHAWPAAYAITVDFPIVGLGVTGQTLVVCTQGYPFTVSGVHPSVMAQAKSASLEPCLSRGSILSTAEGVYYASPNGLVFASQGAITNITRSLLTKDEWSALTTPSSLRAARLGTAYLAFGAEVAGSFDASGFDTGSFAQQDFAGAYSGILVAGVSATGSALATASSDPTDTRVAFNLLSDPSPVSSVQNDPWSGEIFVIKNDNTYRINLFNANPIRRVYKWRSKIFQVSEIKNLGAMKIYWQVPTAAAPDVGPATPFTPVGVEFPLLPDGSTYGVVRVYCDDVLRLTRNLVTSGEIIRMPSGFKASFWQIEFETYVTILSVQFATTVKDLASV